MSTLSNFRRLVLAKAWQLVNETGMPLADALTEAWQLIKLAALKALMKTNTVTVRFRKLNGQIITITGTRNLNLIPLDKHPKYGNWEETYIYALPYYSPVDNAWKVVTAEDLISFESAL